MLKISKVMLILDIMMVPSSIESYPILSFRVGTQIVGQQIARHMEKEARLPLFLALVIEKIRCHGEFLLNSMTFDMKEALYRWLVVRKGTVLEVNFSYASKTLQILMRDIPSLQKYWKE